MPQDQLPDILLDVRDGLTLSRINGVWHANSTRGLDIPTIVTELREQAARMKRRGGLLLDAAAVLESQHKARSIQP